MAYIFGTNDVSRSLKEEISPNVDKMYDSIGKAIAGETWKERIEKTSTKDEIKRIFVSESHRVFSDGQWDSAEGRATHKTWHTVEDEKVRDSHWYIDGLTVGLNDFFNTIDGDRALKPYGFDLAENNVNCRCFLEYSKR